ncbi:hypothetical protein BT63DRAFT_70641 [Microthyrium microscopicum]|uniref:Uncharacterized protein n=1 Tax=Microthyrium microscopicum TaxID=703497 RepID=A0A6A6U1X5_9PEZI|nr:hypothetical protein BT63DRAFT_70641 [Microthyrium microscopicum]
MDRFKGLAKGGWHPEKNSGDGKAGITGLGIRQKASNLGDSKEGITGLGIRQKAKGLVGKSDDRPESTYHSEPYIRKDPAQFAPPPRTKTYAEGEGPVAPPRTASPIEPEVIQDAPSRRAGPFVADTSGIDTSKYPMPPPRNGAVSSSPITSKPKPGLPPRLPPRNEVSTPDPSEGQMNQGAMSRLGAAGISVPAFGIGGLRSPPPLPSRSPGTFGTFENDSIPVVASPTTGTTWAEKQAALKTANNFKNNPGAVSLSEIRTAASTAKNFQDRHGEQVSYGLHSAQQANQRYGLQERMAGLSINPSKPQPPPPPPKKFQGTPPPLHLSSKPKPSAPAV